MMKLKIDDIYVGSIIRIEHDDQFHGFAKLVEPCGELFPVIQDDDTPMFLKQRWMIEWASSEGKEYLSKSEWFTQKTLEGKRCHRELIFEAGIIWEDYIQENSPPKEEVPFSYDKPIDDFGGMF